MNHTVTLDSLSAILGPSDEPPRAVDNLLPIIEQFDRAHLEHGIKYPKIKMRITRPYGDDPAPLFYCELYRAGSASRHEGSVVIKGADDTYIGRILRDGRLQFPASVPDSVRRPLTAHLVRYALNPAVVAGAYGHATNNCCFCSRGLTEQFSVTHGYGPICAVNYGLPHGQNG